MFTVSVLGAAFIGLCVVSSAIAAYIRLKMNYTVEITASSVVVLLLCAVAFVKLGWTALFLGMLIQVAITVMVNVINILRGGLPFAEAMEKYMSEVTADCVDNSFTENAEATA